MKVHNFNAGPSILPHRAIQNTASAIVDLDGTGLSLLEISHRSPQFEKIISQTEALLRELLDIPDNYHVMFLGGGASTQFCMVPFNLLRSKAAYVDTGAWSKKAIADAKLLGDIEVIASSSDKGYSYVPKDYTIPDDADYLHITTNNTICGTELHEDIDSPIPLVADMSSDILSRPIDVSKYALIYGGAQKNMGPAGVSFVIARDEILGKVDRPIPAMLDYRTHAQNGSLYNTPPVAAIYTVNETLKWLKSVGGVYKIYQQNVQKAKLLYDEIDRNSLLRGTAAKQDRSIMNVCFVMSKGHEDKEKKLTEYLAAHNMVGLVGHRSVGGFRASIYNAMPVASVKELVKCLKKFEKENT